MRLCVRLFGAFEATLDGVAVTRFASDKVRALLAYLGLEASQPQRRGKLAGLLWPDYPESSAEASLRNALANLRSVIRDPLAEPPYLLISRQTLQFNRTAGAWFDAVAFGEHLSLADLSSLEQAVELYRGDFLEGFSLRDAAPFEEWVLLTRERYRRLVMEALCRMVEGYGQRGDYERALRYARQQVDLDPWHETSQRQLMRMLALSGRRAEALIQYEACCRLLAVELGATPAAATVSLYEQIRCEQLTAPRQPARQVAQAVVGSLSFPKQDDATDSEMPVFVARECELAQLGAWLDLAMAGRGRVALVRGEAGSGKTALMAEFAQRAMQVHPDLVVASGECSAFLGFGDSYLPLRGTLAMLTGDVLSQSAFRAVRPEHARRLFEAMPATVEALLEHGPQVLELLLQAESLLSRATLAEDGEGAWLQRLRDWLARQRTGPEHQDESQLYQQTTQVLRQVSLTFPLLLVIDDLQWSDRASLSLLFHLGRRLQGSRILLLAAYRPEEAGSWDDKERHPLQKLVDELQRIYGDIGLDLDQLEEARGRAFLDAFLDTEPNQLGEGFRRVLFQHTAGHALFTIELLRAMQDRGELRRDEDGRWLAGSALDWERLPARVEGVIGERLGRLDDNLRELLSVACVEGEYFTVEVAARVMQRDQRAVLRLLAGELGRRHRLVRWSGELGVGGQRVLRYRFAHALFQQFLYTSLDPGERQRLHAEVAAILEDLYEGYTESIAPQLARHYSEAGNELQALRYLTLAGDTALASYAAYEAEICYRRALSMAPEDAPRAHLLEGLGRALAGRSGFPEAIQVWQEAIEINRAGGDQEGMARLFAYAASAAWWDDRPADGLRWCEEGLAATAGAPESPGRAGLLNESARCYYFAGFPERAWRLCRQALEMAERLGAVEVQADALVTLGSLPGQAAQDAQKALTQAAQLAESSNLLDVAFRAYNNLALLKAMIYGPRAGCEELRRAVQLSRQAGNVAREMLALGNLLEALLALGEFEQAETSLSHLRRLATELDDPVTAGHRLRRLEAAVLLHQGEWQRAASLLRICQAEARALNHLQSLLNADLLLARVLLEAHALDVNRGSGDWGEVRNALTEAVEIARLLDEPEASVWCRAYLAVMHAGQRQPQQARDQMSGARAAAQHCPVRPIEAALFWAEAMLDAAEGRWAEAAAANDSLAALCSECSMRWARARALIDWAAALASRGEAEDMVRARSLLQESRDAFQSMGIVHYAELASERLMTLQLRD